MKRATALLTMIMVLLSCFILPVSAQSHPFSDVSADAWYAEYVQYVFENSLMNGISETEFSPESQMNRAMLVTVLHRMDGSKNATETMPFTDIDSDAYYYDALVWAYENEIINGISESRFGPDISITREMMVTIFCRYAKYRELDTSKLSSLFAYSDKSTISTYAKDPFRWAVAARIISGDTQNTLAPKGTATRAQCAAILERFCQWEEAQINGTPETPPAEENPPVYDDGPVAYVNAVRIEDTLREDGVIYIAAHDFCLAMNGVVNSDGSASLAFDGMILTFSPGCEYIMYGDQYIVLTCPVLTSKGKAYVPMEEMCDMLELSVYMDSQYDGVYCTASAWEREIPKGYDVPVLMYHAVSNDLWGIQSLFVKPELMEQQLRYLTQNGYDPIFFEDLYHIEDYDKPVILTFDDGYADNYTELFPLLKKYNVKATVFVLAGSINSKYYMTDAQIKEMADSGLVSIQSHTVTHPMLSDLSMEEQRREMEQSKLMLTRITKREPYVLAYPTGDYNSTTLRIVENFYDFGILMRGNLYNTRDNRFMIKRYFISRNTTTSTYRGILETVF